MHKFNIGDKVKITKGSFANMNGSIEGIDGFDGDPENGIAYEYSVRLENTEKLFPIIISEFNLEKIEPNLFEQSLKDYNHSIENSEVFFEMATVKWGFMSIKLSVYGKEGKYPHFHFYKGLKPEGGIPEEYLNGGGCLCLEEAKYFIHANHTETMDPKEIKGLIKFLQTANKTFKNITNWEYIIGLWNDNNPDQKQLDLDIPIPDYKSDMDNIIDD